MALPTKLTLNIVTPDHSYCARGGRGVAARLRGRLRRAARPHAVFRRAPDRADVLPPGRANRTASWSAIGFAEVLPDKVTVLAQVAETAEELDEARAEAGMTRAEEMLAPVPHEIDFERARVALLRTLQQLQADSPAR